MWKLIDLSLILTKNFKNKNGEYITINKPFWKIWSNILSICIIILSLLITSIAGFVIVIKNVTYNSKYIAEEVEACLNDPENVNVLKNEKAIASFFENKGYDEIESSFPYEKKFQNKIDKDIFLEFSYYINYDKTITCNVRMLYTADEDYIVTLYPISSESDFSNKSSIYVNLSASYDEYIVVHANPNELVYISVNNGSDYESISNNKFENKYEKEYNLTIDAIDIFTIEYSNIIK